jgi:hypothetical protein
MSEDQKPNNEPLKNLADLLSDIEKEPARTPGVTDQHILRAMLGKPWGLPASAPQDVRKAG